MSNSRSSSILQVTNVSPSATSEQLRTLFGHVGVLDDVVLYGDDKDESASKVCYVRYNDPINVEVALHLNNTVFLDRVLIVLPLAVDRDSIPDEKYASSVRAPPNTAAGVLPRTADWPLDVMSMVVGRPGEQVIHTIEPRLTSLAFPLYPPLPATTDGTRIEEIRRTVLVTNLEPKTTGEQVLEFFNKYAEVRCVRMAGTDVDRAAYVEFTQQPSIIKAFGLMGATLNGRQIMIQHSNCAIIKPANNIAVVDDLPKQSAGTESIHSSRHSDRGRSRSRSHDRRSRSHHSSGSRRRRSRSKNRRRSRSYRGRGRRRSRSRSRSYSRDRRRYSRSRSRDNRRLERERSRSYNRRRYRRSRSRSDRRYSRSRSRGRRNDRRDRDYGRYDRRFRDRDRERERDRDRDFYRERDRDHDRERIHDRDRDRNLHKDRGRDRVSGRSRDKERPREGRREHERRRSNEKDKAKRRESKSSRRYAEDGDNEDGKSRSPSERNHSILDTKSVEPTSPCQNKSKSKDSPDEKHSTADTDSVHDSVVESDNDSVSKSSEHRAMENGGSGSETDDQDESNLSSKPAVLGVKLAGPEDMDYFSNNHIHSKVVVVSSVTVAASEDSFGSDSSGDAMDTEV